MIAAAPTSPLLFFLLPILGVAAVAVQSWLAGRREANRG